MSTLSKCVASTVALLASLVLLGGTARAQSRPRRVNSSIAGSPRLRGISTNGASLMASKPAATARFAMAANPSGVLGSVDRFIFA